MADVASLQFDPILNAWAAPETIDASVRALFEYAADHPEGDERAWLRLPLLSKLGGRPRTPVEGYGERLLNGYRYGGWIRFEQGPLHNQFRHFEHWTHHVKTVDARGSGTCGVFYAGEFVGHTVAWCYYELKPWRITEGGGLSFDYVFVGSPLLPWFDPAIVQTVKG